MHGAILIFFFFHFKTSLQLQSVPTIPSHMSINPYHSMNSTYTCPQTRSNCLTVSVASCLCAPVICSYFASLSICLDCFFWAFFLSGADFWSWAQNKNLTFAFSWVPALESTLNWEEPHRCDTKTYWYHCLLASRLISISNTSSGIKGRVSARSHLSFFCAQKLVLVRRRGGWSRYISFSFSSHRPHSSQPFDETREQTWAESGDLWPVEVCKPLKPSALLMNSQCNHTERSTVCTGVIDPLSSLGAREL